MSMVEARRSIKPSIHEQDPEVKESVKESVKKSKKLSRKKAMRAAMAVSRPSTAPEPVSVLTSTGVMMVLQSEKPMEDVFGFKPISQYSVIDGSGRKILDVGENVTGCKCTPASVRPFLMKMVDQRMGLFMTIKRPCMFKYPWDICHQRLLVYFPPGVYIGRVKQSFGFLSPKFIINGSDGATMYHINIIEDESSVWEIWSSNTKFQIQDKTNKTIGTIIKAKDKLNEPTKGFRVSFEKRLDVPTKALIVGASFLIESMYFGKI